MYVNVATAFKPSEWTLDTTTDPANPVLHITVKGKSATLPVSKDTMTVAMNNGHKTTTYNLEGLVVRSPMISQVYVPMQVIRILK